MQEGNKLNKLGYFDKDITEENEVYIYIYIKYMIYI